MDENRALFTSLTTVIIIVDIAGGSQSVCCLSGLQLFYIYRSETNVKTEKDELDVIKSQVEAKRYTESRHYKQQRI